MRKKVAEAKKRRGDIIDLGVGDVCLPLFPSVTAAMKKACSEMRETGTFKGYPPAEGYDFLREKIAATYDGEISADEVFITDGAKSELGNITELFPRGVKVLFPTPCYPAGIESNVLAGNDVKFLKTRKEDDFLPFPPENEHYDLIYLCSPQNPTGTVMSKEILSRWITYALSENAVIISDAAYREFLPENAFKNPYKIRGAKSCLIEINSFSKSLGFTGVRCGYTIIPRETKRIYELKKRWLGCRFNGVSYISQRGAEAFYSAECAEEVKNRIIFYKTNAEILKNALKNKNLWYNIESASPYVFFEVPTKFKTDEFCDFLLSEQGIAATPGNGFGDGGEGFVRFSAFCTRKNAILAGERIKRADF